ncbi:MAG TPA: outer membrane protein assembly factor BamA [Tepidisphaeraceae bacterium]
MSGLIGCPCAFAQPPATNPAATPAAELKGRTVEQVRIVGNAQVQAAAILNLVRTHEGDKFDPATVEEDYQRIYGLKKFSNVEAKVEPTATGVIVVFQVTEQRQIREIFFRGNQEIATEDLQNVVELSAGQAIDRFRISYARQAIENLYHSKNYPYAHVEVPQEALAQDGQLIFKIVEGPRVRIRKVNFGGNYSFTEDKLFRQIHTRSWWFFFKAGTYDPDMIDDDVAALRRFYQQKGYFDVRVGRKLDFSKDQSELMVSFEIEEGPRYTIDHIIFKNVGENVLTISDSALRNGLKLIENQPYDAEILQRDVQQIVKAYSPYGYIYEPSYRQPPNPEYLHITPRPIFRKEAGRVDLVYEISEGKPFYLGRIMVSKNTRTQSKVILREMRVAPGQLYNSGEIQDAIDRLRGTPYFSSVTITPIGDDPKTRDVLVEVAEAKTASFTIGAGINSNGGLGGQIVYDQRNFDIANFPDSWTDIFSDRAFTGAGQDLRISLEPGLQQNNASVRFSEPWLFDQPYSFTGEAFLRDRLREHYEEERIGGRVGLGKRFNYTWSALLSLRGEDVQIKDVTDPAVRAPEITNSEGHSTLTSVGLTLRRDTTNREWFASRGSNTSLSWESAGALGGDFSFQRLTAAWTYHQTIYEDLLDRKWTLTYHVDAGYIWGDAPFFERFYAGGIGTVRGFRFRGISPRAGIAQDPVGGNFTTTGTIELGFPIAGENFRGVVFTDAGTVEDSFRFGTLRASAGAGFRLMIPFLGQIPIAVDFAIPLNKASEDDVQIISFSLGIFQ